MKKLVKFLVPFLVASSAIFSGCKKKETKDERVLLSFGDMHADGVTLIDLPKLNELVKAKESFLFVVSTNTCGCWSEFEPNLTKYVNENKLTCYRIDFNTIKDVAPAYGLTLLSSSTTTFAIFEDGKLKTLLDSSEDGAIMYDETRFTKYMNENVKLPGCYFITKEDVKSIESSDKNAVIYFERTACGDCQALHPTILRSYVEEHPNANKIYVFDFQPYWRNSEAEDYKSYLDLKDELGLAEITKDEEGTHPSTVNPTFGFDTGVFPYFSFIENGSFASGCVVYNDHVEKQEDKFVVTNSYYSNTRVNLLEYTNTVLIGKELTREDVLLYGEYAMWAHESANNIYKDILYSFLDYALPKTTYTF